MFFERFLHDNEAMQAHCAATCTGTRCLLVGLFEISKFACIVPSSCGGTCTIMQLDESTLCPVCLLSSRIIFN